MQKKRSQRGMSALELTIGIGITTLIGFAIFVFGRDVFFLNTVVQSGLSAQQDGRQVVRQIARELRTASQSSTGSYPLLVANANDITFYSDIDDDGLKEEVRYYLEGVYLKKAVRKPSGNPLNYSGSPSVGTIIYDIQNGGAPIFSYYDTNYGGSENPLTAPINLLAVRLIKISLSIERDPYRSPTPVTVTTQVTLRNLKDNL